MATAAAKQGASDPQEAQIRKEYALRQFMTVQNEIRQESQLISKLEIEKKECSEVLKILHKINNPERRCWYSIDGTLVEMTIKQVLPRLDKDLSDYDHDLTARSKQLQTKENLLAQFAVDSGLTKPTPQQRSALAKQVKSATKASLPSISE